MSDWLTKQELRGWLGMSPSTFRRRLPELQAEGFPQPRAGRWYLPALDDWARRSAETETFDETIEQWSAGLHAISLT